MNPQNISFYRLLLLILISHIFFSCNESPGNGMGKKSAAETAIDSDTMHEIDSVINKPGQDTSVSSTIRKDSLSKKADSIKPVEWYLNQLPAFDSSQLNTGTTCYGTQCLVWVNIRKSNQMLYLYFKGQLIDSFKVSTGMKKYETPSLNLQPQGPIYTKYNSRKFPGGNYKGLGNMPYAVFLTGGFAIHGTTQGNIARLGKKASHGCIRLHPENGKIFNEVVRKAGLHNTWVTIEE